MLIVDPITSESIEQLQAVYERFISVAKEDYQWDVEPVSFLTFKQAVLLSKQIEGYYLHEAGDSNVVGFMLFRCEEHRAIEINLIYSETENPKVFLDVLMKRLIQDLKTRDDWDVISYAMLGKQGEFIRTILWYGFKPVGQCILDFDMLNHISVQIMKQQSITLAEDGYRIDTWKPEYANAIADCIYQCFSNAVDAFWDPRFTTLSGAKSALSFITSGNTGSFMPDCTGILLKENTPVGFCFVVQTDLTVSNIPLVGIHPSIKKKGLGKFLLKNTLELIIQAFLAEKNSILKVTTTTDTENIPAIKMYRRIGFQETENYPHVYLPREKALTYQPGKWC